MPRGSRSCGRMRDMPRGRRHRVTEVASSASPSPTGTRSRISPTAPPTRSSRWPTGWRWHHEGGPVRGLDRHMPAIRQALTDRADRADDRVPVVVLRGPLVATRRPEFSARVLYREGVSRERERDHDRRHDERAEKRHQSDRLRASNRITRPVRNRRSDRHATGRERRLVEPAGLAISS